ncbi:6-phospho-3-hexuloisomerase [Collinsella sp. AGMB00827]|uniref:6-phospho-3-hexuloisomerase n=1 Tax=Collinsella ureilytica TaxID=2869515 RepID=A0ABS7MK67_9ACTN|nr:6-phospho-3-hexuloisomerase [Collinsella urealyticum]MBY4797662.1 6-phospho-3-hexuloisomerase [Collinsella urealyticum]
MSEIKAIMLQVADELTTTFSELNEAQLKALESEILSAKKIFVAGAGRSLMMIRGLAMRLMHMGFESYVVGETVTPAIEPGDLLVIASGSGATGTLRVIAEKCKQLGAALALITTQPESPIGSLADVVVEVGAVSTKVEQHARSSIQPGSNTFEQTVLLIGDAIIIDIVSDETIAQRNEELMRRHANLE